MRTRKLRWRNSRTRSAFSMVEVLIVIGIIGLLTALIVFAMGPSLQTARINATKTTIAKLHDIVQQRVDAIARMDVSVEAKKLASLNSGLTERQAEFLIRQNLFKQALPQRPEDLAGLDGGSGGSDNAPLRALWISAGGAADSSSPNKQLNAEIFLFALTRGGQLRVLPNGKSYTVPTLDIGQINPKHVQDTNLDSNGVPAPNGLMEFVDEWNQPLRFYRAPTRMIRSDGTNITAGDLQTARILISGLPSDTSDTGPNGQDPFDPTRTLSTPFTGASFNLTHAPGQTLTCVGFQEDGYHTPNTYYAPLIVSAGPDEDPGMGEPTSATAAERLGLMDTDTMTSGIQISEFLTDNITNRQQ